MFELSAEPIIDLIQCIFEKYDFCRKRSLFCFSVNHVRGQLGSHNLNTKQLLHNPGGGAPGRGSAYLTEFLGDIRGLTDKQGRSQTEALASVIMRACNPKYMGKEFNRGHCLGHNFFLATALTKLPIFHYFFVS